MEKQVIVLTPEQLQAMIDKSVNALLNKLKRHDNIINDNDIINIDEAVFFLKKNGVPLARNYIYTLTHQKEIPYKKNGKYVVFSKKELLQWIDNRITRPETKSDAVKELAKSANRKGRK